MAGFDNLKLDNQLCFALYSATNAITRMYRSLLNELDLTYPQYLVLLVLWERDGVAIRDLIKRLRLDSGTLSPLLKRLEKAGLIEKKRMDLDERVVRVFLTAQAKKIEPQVAEIQQQVACQTGLSDQDFFQLLDRLNQLAASLSEQETHLQAKAG